MAKAVAKELKVHEAAELFPMLSNDELDELADDIKANGLVHPIVVKDGVLIDGRNRMEACRRAGVEPRFVDLNGHDPVAFILSANINRRHMTKGQRAMAVARMYPEAAKLRRAGSGSLEIKELNAGYVSQARAVLKWAPELADPVLSGAHPLDKAYAVASERKVASETPLKRLQVLRATDPDLADKVVEESLSLDDAEGASKARRDRERSVRQGTYDALGALERYLFVLSEPSQREALVHTVRNFPNEISRDDLIANLDAWAESIAKTKEALTRES